MTRETKITFWALTAFSIAMGFLESSVVIYLREIYYPDGFRFPMVKIEEKITLVELCRELATIIMLWGVAYVAGKTFLHRFVYFCFCFAVWDILYYVFLYAFLQWPESLFTWDILFLIPVPWIGPVWAPMLISLTMIVAGIFYIQRLEKKNDFKIKKTHWLFLICGAAFVLLSFVWDFIKLAQGKSSKDIERALYTFIPTDFSYLIFFLGYSVMLVSLFLPFINPKNKYHEKK